MDKANSAQEENLLEHVKVLATAEGRAIGTPGHLRARKYLCANLKHFGLIPYTGASFELNITTSTEELVNIIAVAPGKDRAASPVLLGAHYDTFSSFPGADDNAAAVSILLEIGKELIRNPADCDVIFAFFDNEEMGFMSRASMGSMRFYNDQLISPVRCALIFDLVGHEVPVDGLESMMFVTGMESSSSWGSLLKKYEPEKGLAWAAVLDSYVGSLSDHYIFSENNDPYLFFSCGRWAHYHEPTDTYEKLSYSKMSQFKDVLHSIVLACTKQEFAKDKYDSVNDEAYFLQKNVLPKLGMRSKISSRKDIDKLVSMMLKQFNL